MLLLLLSSWPSVLIKLDLCARNNNNGYTGAINDVAATSTEAHPQIARWPDWRCQFGRQRRSLNYRQPKYGQRLTRGGQPKAANKWLEHVLVTRRLEAALNKRAG